MSDQGSWVVGQWEAVVTNPARKWQWATAILLVIVLLLVATMVIEDHLEEPEWIGTTARPTTYRPVDTSESPWHE